MLAALIAGEGGEAEPGRGIGVMAEGLGGCSALCSGLWFSAAARLGVWRLERVAEWEMAGNA